MAINDKFLKPNEVTICKRLAVSDNADNKRATALLAIHTGETQVSAGAISGLTVGQVRYIVRRFRVMRLAALSYDKAIKAKAEPTIISNDKPAKKTKKADKKSKKKHKKSKDIKDKKGKKAKDKKPKKDKKSKDKKKSKKKK